MQKMRKDMAYEDFVNLAKQRPNLEGKWLYRYIAYIVDSDITKPYPQFGIEESKRVLFTSHSEAESYMIRFIQEESMQSDDDSGYEFYCHRIVQIPIGKSESQEGASWLYDSYGNLLDYQNNLTYYGRTPERLRFHEGDIVEVVDRNVVRLAVVSYPSLTVDDCWQRYEEYTAGEYDDYVADPLDDSCIVFYGPGRDDFDHVVSVNIMKPHFFVTDELKNRMRKWQEK